MNHAMSKIVNTTDRLVETTLISSKKGNHDNFKTEEILMKKLVEFYSYSINLEQLLTILVKKSKVSLRILDWFVTTYAKEYKVSYNIIHQARSKRFCIYDSYKAQLKAFHKRLFDPFCRGRRIYFEYCDGCEIETTVGQLNFFKWCIQNKVLEYVETNITRIIQHMALNSKQKDEISSISDDKTTTTTTKLSSTASISISGEIRQDGAETIITANFQ